MNQKRIAHMIEREKYFIESLASKDLSCHGYWDMGYHQGRLSVLENMEGMSGPWIPVAERPPEIGEPVVITLWDKDVTIGTWYGHRWGTALCYHEDVLAWMPLPEPYKTQD